jgi:hypothetical protein
LSAATDLVDDGVDGLISEPSVAGLAAAIGELLGHPGRRRRIATAARKSAAAHDWAERAVAMERVYREAIAIRSPGRGRGTAGSGADAPAETQPEAATAAAGDGSW